MESENLKNKNLKPLYPLKYPQHCLPTHTKSWDENQNERTRNSFDAKNRKLSSQSFATPGQRNATKRQQSQQRFLGPDPTVAHLKYGIFPKKPNRVSTKIEDPKKKPLTPGLNQSKNETRGLPKKVPQQDPETVETIEKRLLGNLSRSASTHVDIKPQKYNNKLPAEKSPRNVRSLHNPRKIFYS